MKQAITIFNIHLLFLLLLVSACQKPTRQFKQLEQGLSLEEAHTLNDFTPDSILEKAWQNGQTLKQELTILSEQLKQQQSDLPYYQLSQRLEGHLKQIKLLQNDASLYNLGGHLKVALSQTQSPIENRLLTCDSLLSKAPAYYAAAKQKLKTPLPDRLELAVRKQVLGLYFLTNHLPDSLATLKVGQQENWQKNTVMAKRAMKDYIAWCNSQLIDYHAIENSSSDE